MCVLPHNSIYIYIWNRHNNIMRVNENIFFFFFNAIPSWCVVRSCGWNGKSCETPRERMQQIDAYKISSTKVFCGCGWCICGTRTHRMSWPTKQEWTPMNFKWYRREKRIKIDRIIAYQRALGCLRVRVIIVSTISSTRFLINIFTFIIIILVYFLPSFILRSEPLLGIIIVGI